MRPNLFRRGLLAATAALAVFLTATPVLSDEWVITKADTDPWAITITEEVDPNFDYFTGRLKELPQELPVRDQIASTMTNVSLPIAKPVASVNTKPVFAGYPTPAVDPNCPDGRCPLVQTRMIATSNCPDGRCPLVRQAPKPQLVTVMKQVAVACPCGCKHAVAGCDCRGTCPGHRMQPYKYVSTTVPTASLHNLRTAVNTPARPAHQVASTGPTSVWQAAPAVGTIWTTNPPAQPPAVYQAPAKVYQAPADPQMSYSRQTTETVAYSGHAGPGRRALGRTRGVLKSSAGRARKVLSAPFRLLGCG